MQFTKMHGLGNDYIFVYGEPEKPKELSIKLSDRHFGIGSDGMIWISSSKIADFKMRIFNADGSEAEMCGNGIRCVGKYVYEKGYTNKTKIDIETLSGIKTLELHLKNNQVNNVTVDMGKGFPKEDITLDINDEIITCTPVSVGNPHAVIFVDDIDCINLSSIGPKIEHHQKFPEGVNVEFIQVIDEKNLRMRVWERGSGITMACGTGACASVMAAITKEICNDNDLISVHLDGGTLEIKVDAKNHVTMTGPATIAYEGEIDLKSFDI